MPLSDTQIQALALRLQDARLAGREIEPLAKELPDLSLPQAYAIQQHGIALRTAAGETVVGYKMGLTSKAKREQMNLHQAIYGVLTDRMQVKDGAAFSLTGTIHPKIEPEIAFRLKKPLRGVVTESQVLEACDGVACAMEILDSRFTGFKYFSLPDVVADNSSSSHFVIGQWIKAFKDIDLANLKMTLRVNGEIAQEAQSNVISGNPLRSVVELCALLNGEEVAAGSVILAGAATVAVALAAGQNIETQVEHLGSVRLTVTN